MIPLVSSRFRLRGFGNLPILYVEDWGKIDSDFLRDAYENLARKRVSTKLAFMDHWQRALETERIGLRRYRREKER